MRGRNRSEKVDALRLVPLFKELSKRDLRYIVTLAKNYMVEPEHPLVVQNERGGDCLVIVAGKARVEREGKTLAHVGPGDVVREISLIDGLPRAATVVAEDWIEVVALENRDFKSLLRSSPALQHKVMFALCSRLRAADSSLTQ